MWHEETENAAETRRFSLPILFDYQKVSVDSIGVCRKDQLPGSASGLNTLRISWVAINVW